LSDDNDDYDMTICPIELTIPHQSTQVVPTKKAISIDMLAIKQLLARVQKT
jgi:hypothetical protein